MRPHYRSLRRWTVLPALGLVLVTLGACRSGTGSGADPEASGPAGALGSAPSATATTPAPDSGTGGDSDGDGGAGSGDGGSGDEGSGDGDSGSGSGSGSEDLPASWRLCQNVLRGSSMGYPGDWYTTSLTEADACSQFHPTEFTIPVNGEYPRTALNAVQLDDSPASYVAQVTDPTFATAAHTDSTTVAGLPATRFEVTSTGEGLSEAGERKYGYVIDRGGRAFVLWTVAPAGESRYSAWKHVVDTAKGTLRFL